MEKKRQQGIWSQINKLKSIAKFGTTQWQESRTAAVKIFFAGEKTVSFLSVGVLNEFNIITSNLYEENQILKSSYSLKNFIEELMDLLRLLNEEQRDAIKKDWNEFTNRLIELPDVKYEIAVPIYGVVSTKPYIELESFKIYKKKNLKTKYVKSSNPAKLPFKSEYYLTYEAVAKTLDKCNEIAEEYFFVFENVANFIITGFHKTYKISLFRDRFSSQVEHLAFTEKQILGGGRTLHRFETVNIENPHFSDKKIGYGEIWSLITSKKNELQNKILESIEWSGKASVETDDSKALLLYIIAIEAILNYTHNSSLYVPTTISLADSVAFLLGKNKQSRKQYAKYVTELYKIRSGIVHGSIRRISEMDLHTAFSISHQILKKILSEEPYKSFVTKKQLSEYLLKEKKYEMGES